MENGSSSNTANKNTVSQGGCPCAELSPGPPTCLAPPTRLAPPMHPSRPNSWGTSSMKSS